MPLNFNKKELKRNSILFEVFRAFVALVTIPLVLWLIYCIYLRVVGVPVTENETYKLSWTNACVKYEGNLLSAEPPTCKLSNGNIVHYHDVILSFQDIFWRPKIMNEMKLFAVKAGIIEDK